MLETHLLYVLSAYGITAGSLLILTLVVLMQWKKATRKQSQVSDPMV